MHSFETEVVLFLTETKSGLATRLHSSNCFAKAGCMEDIFMNQMN